MGFLIIAWLLIWCLKNAASDVAYALQGETPPRYKLRMQRAEMAGNSTRPARYGTRDWFADLWSDALEARTARRRADAAAEQRDQTPPQPSVEPAPATQPAPEPTPQDVRPPPPPNEPTPAPPVEPQPTPVPDDRPDARVIPLFPTPKKPTQEEPMTANTIEITGLQSAIEYVNDTAAAHEAHSTAGNEAFIGSLQSFNVTGTTIQLIADAQEASANAADMWRQAATALGEQMTVKEAYDNNPDAGSQEFVQGE